jgi:hypothetical protein
MDHKEMSDKVEKVLNEVIPSIEGHEEGDILVDWIVVAYVTNVDDNNLSGYPTLYANGHMPTYRARGLLQTGLNNLK